MRSHENEAFTLSRNTQAVMVPSGDAIELQAGLSGFITQALGGSFTLYIEGNLYRLSGENADAIGKQALTPPALPPGATEDDIKSLAWQQMRSCYDPEIPIDIVELGLVYECEVAANEDGTRTLAVKMTLTAPGCGMGDVLVQDVKEKLEIIPTVTKAEVELVFDPPWNQSMMSEAARLQTGMM
ncbi:MAG: putative Fe-S cluster assembly protein SufT [Gammaproteobacteria bacterium]|jgi:probable FeS assembly SUF system protein SufT|nr:putative Fe-S cluster assembly protein SufT [Gammaproteobacteria bacterium]